MTESLNQMVVELLQAYEGKRSASGFVIANEMEIEPSNYYLYRKGRGNPTCKTVSKITRAIRKRHPEILERVLRRMLREVHTSR